MKPSIRITLDWIELPFTILWAVFGKIDKTSLTKMHEVKNFRSETVPFKTIRWIISKRVQPPKQINQ